MKMTTPKVSSSPVRRVGSSRVQTKGIIILQLKFNEALQCPITQKSRALIRPFLLAFNRKKFFRHWPLAYSSREKLEESSGKVIRAGREERDDLITLVI